MGRISADDIQDPEMQKYLRVLEELLTRTWSEHPPPEGIEYPWVFASIEHHGTKVEFVLPEPVKGDVANVVMRFAAPTPAELVTIDYTVSEEPASD